MSARQGDKLDPHKIAELLRSIEDAGVTMEGFADLSGVDAKTLRGYRDEAVNRPQPRLQRKVLTAVENKPELKGLVKPRDHYRLGDTSGTEPALPLDAETAPPPAKTLRVQVLVTPDATHEAAELCKRLQGLAAELRMPGAFQVAISAADAEHPALDPDAALVIAVLGCTLGAPGSEQARQTQRCWEGFRARCAAAEDSATAASAPAIVYRRNWRDCAPNARDFDDPVALDAATEAARQFRTWADALLDAATAHALPGQTHGLTCIAYHQDEIARLADRLAGDLAGPVEALLPALSAAPGAGETDTAGAERWMAGSPFRGLLPLTDDYALVFKGRGRHVDALMKLLRNPRTRFVAVEGASGSGKSSLVWAGLLPRLARGGAIEGSEHWLAVRFVPTDRPFNELATQLSAHPQLKGHWPNPGPLVDQLRRPVGGFADVLRQALAGRPQGARLLLFVDQFEELFTMPAADGAADGPPWPWEPFVALLSDAAAEERARVVVTMRREFASRVSDTPALAALFNQARYALPMPSQAEREKMILEPARLAGIRFPADVAAEIVLDTGDEPGALAMMAHTLAALVAPEAQPECPAEEVLRRLQALEPADFRLRLDKMRGAKGAIAASAEQALGKFREAHGGQCADEALALLFGKLVQVADLDKPPTRCRAPKAVLGAADGPAARLAALLEDEARLLVSDGPRGGTAPEASAEAQADDPPRRVATIEVAHEALLTEWPLLAKWIDARKDQLWLKHRLAGLTQLWLAHDCHRGYLAAAVQVAEMRDAMAALGEALTPEQRAFLDPGFRADWLLQRDLAAWQQAGRPDDRLWGDDRFLGFVPEDRAELDTDDEPGEAAAPAASAAPQPPEPPLLPEPATAEQWQAQRERRRFLSRSFERVLADHAGRPMRRTRCAEGLARLGDPRFDPLHWHLPDDDMLGFREVPAGRFLMGTPPAQARWDELYHPREGVPEHPVALRTFYLARWPVTVGQFRAYLTAADVRERWPIDAWDQHWRTALPTMPVVYVSCAEASAYIDWLAQQMRTQAGRRVERLEARIDGAPEGQAAYRFWKAIAERAVNPGLPSEAEWEKAARGGEDRADAHGRVYPWGDDFDATRTNGEATRIGGACPVGCFPAGGSPVGCEDLSGNVWEWTRSLWGRQEDTPDYPYPYDPDDAEREDPQAPGDRRRVLRGGSFGGSSNFLRCAMRLRNFPGGRNYVVGFRVAWSPYL